MALQWSKGHDTVSDVAKPTQKRALDLALADSPKDSEVLDLSERFADHVAHFLGVEALTARLKRAAKFITHHHTRYQRCSKCGMIVVDSRTTPLCLTYYHTIVESAWQEVH